MIDVHEVGTLDLQEPIIEPCLACYGTILVNAQGRILRIDAKAREILKASADNSAAIESLFQGFIQEHHLSEQREIHNQTLTLDRIRLSVDAVPVTISRQDMYIITLRRNRESDALVHRLIDARHIAMLLDSVIEHSYDGIYITDGDANTLLINKSYEQITGLKRDQMLHKNMGEIVQEGYISRSGSLTVMQTRDTVTMNQSFQTGKTALITSKPVFDAAGNIVLIITNVRDMTDLYSLQRRLEEQENLNKRYLSTIAELKEQLSGDCHIIVEDPAMISVLQSARKVGPTDISVHISGESGVGKEVMARFIHKNSQRKKGEFVPVNCGAIPESLIETELFGYVKGAFSGADPKGKKGLFESADGGTLFLDEIGELPLNLQVKLLRVLQERELVRVGDTQPRKVDMRIISASNRKLEDMVADHSFRADLYYRLNGVPIVIPPLRERRQDISSLILHFLNKMNSRYDSKKTIDRQAMQALDSYDWPGNIRELKNLVERLVVLSTGERIGCEDLPPSISQCACPPTLGASVGIMPLKEAVAELESHMIDQAYQTYGNVRDAAKVLEIDPATLVRKRKKYSSNSD